MLVSFSMQSSQRYLLLLPIFLTATLLVLYTWQPSHLVLPQLGTSNNPLLHPGPGLAHHSQTPPGDNLYDVQNNTLGFQEIRVISLPSRTDKHDAWAVSASISGFRYTIADGVDSNNISEKSLPYTMAQEPKITACWRAHMDVLQDIVTRGVATTLIFEDDADWDVALKSQLVQFALGSRWLLNSTSLQSSESKFNSPYGPGWDMLWIGHCGARADPWDHRRFVIPNDPTVEPAPFRQYGPSPDMYHWENQNTMAMQTRVVVSQYFGVCTASYAISFEGAKKALYHLSMSPYNAPVDWGYSDMCRQKHSGFTCIAPYPPIVGLHRPAGDISRWSDIETGEGQSEVAHSEHLVYSTRMNLERLLKNERMMSAAHLTASMTGVDEMDIDEIGVAVGHEEEIGEIGEKDSEY